MVQNKALIFRKVPTGSPVDSEHIVVEDWPIDLDGKLQEGDILVQNLYVSLDPYMRGRLRDPKIKSYVPAFELGQPLTTRVVARVLRSESDRFNKDDIISGVSPLANYAVITKQLQSSGLDPTRVITNPHKVGLEHFQGALGNPGLTAWAGVREIGKPKKGETIFVSAASGAVGQIVCQICKKEGLRVIGSAGDDQKVKFLTEELGVEAFNYKKEDTAKALERLGGGIDIFWDNVGGKTLEAALAAMKPGGRIPVCGQITGYNSKPEDAYGIKNLFNLVAKQIVMHGFLSMTYFAKYDEDVRDTLGGWIADGSLKTTLDIRDGIEQSGKLLADIFEGRNQGKALVRLAE